MTTILDERYLPPANRGLSQYLQNWLECLEADSSLFEPEQLRKRLDALDQFDARFKDFRAEESRKTSGFIAVHQQSVPGWSPPMPPFTDRCASTLCVPLRRRHCCDGSRLR